ncbi:MAG TPA: hypothetical protein VF540_12640 [Segetibacter sp.]
MKRLYAAITVIFVFVIGAKPVDQFPQAEITNGIIHARFYLPDAKNGYYRGSRFDWSGVMPELEYKGHSYFGQWFDKYSPTLHDAIMGPVEAFSPVGYYKAKVGDNFLIVGIGMVTKPEEPKYSFVTPYQIVNGGAWKVNKKSDQVEFIQKLNDKEYAYDYRKTVQLIKGTPQMILMHTLKNTGKQVIETDVYNHNFFVMDKQPTDSAFVVKFPFNLINEAGQTRDDLGKIQDNEILFLKNLSENEHLFYPSLTGFSNSLKDYDIRIENRKTGAGVKITSDQPLSKLVFWSAPKTLCPEPYIKIKVNPGEEFSWKLMYEFYTIPD